VLKQLDGTLQLDGMSAAGQTGHSKMKQAETIEESFGGSEGVSKALIKLPAVLFVPSLW